jgi:ribosomal protein S18 acetylase RimI-like enzyme
VTLLSIFEEQLIVSGEIKHYVTKQWYPYEMRLVTTLDLPAMIALYDVVIENLEKPDMLWRYPNEMVAAFLGRDGIVAGIFVGERLVGFRVLYFHHAGDLTNPLLYNEHAYGETAHLALSVIHPDFRGNSLQKKMSAELVRLAQVTRLFAAMCSVVSPHNYSVDMVVVKLMPKFKGVWRYIFYRNMDEPMVAWHADLIFVPSHDYPRQVELLDQGYYGVQLGESNGEMGMIFRKLQVK